MSTGADVSFARKYRPKTFNEYMGSHIREILSNRFSDSSNFPQTILLYGTRGTGKTSASRLIAKEYLCLNRENGHACGHCEMCEEIDTKLINSEAGVSAMGVQEIDIASENGKASIDSLLEDALIEPMYPLNYKVLILDEFHMATKSAQNRLLKIFEEPPRHLVFILCTTNPESILDTILSRCQLKIEVKKASINELADRLLYVCQQENIKTSLEALKIIAKKSDRVPREALMLLESVAKNYGNEVTIANIQKHTGDVDSKIYTEFYKSANSSLEDILVFNRFLKDNDITPKKFLDGLTRFTLDCMYIKYGIGLEDYAPEYVKGARQIFKEYNSNELDILLQIIEHALKMLDSSDTKAEMILTTTAMRVSKLKLLSGDLSNEKIKADKENKTSMNNYRDILKAEEQATRKVTTQEVTDTLLLGAFGGVTETLTIEPDIETDTSEIDVDTVTLTDDELMDMFNI